MCFLQVGGVIMDEYRENIIAIINTIENVDLLEYLEEYIRLKIKAEE